MANKDLLKKIGICIMGVIVVAGVMLFIFKDNTQETVPTNNDFAITTEVSTEDTPAEVGLIEDEVKFNEVEMPTVEETTEEIVEETIEETIEDSDTLPGITVIEESTEEETVEEPETIVAEREIIAMDKVMYAQKDCNVRADAGTEHKKVGSLGKNDKVTVTGETKDDNGNTWYEIELEDGEKGYVSGSLVGDNPVQESSVHNNSGSSNTSSSGVTNTDSIPTTSSEDQMKSIFGDAYMGSGVGLPGGGGSGNME